MIVRAALLLLLLVLAVRVIGRWRRLAAKPQGGAIEAARKCPGCGAYVLAGETCPCTRA